MNPSAPVHRLLDSVAWEAIPPPIESSDPGILYATHQGILRLGEAELRCYQLSDGRRIFDSGDVHRFFGIELPERATGAEKP